MGISAAGRLPEGEILRAWLARGFHADMRWMENASRREDPACLMPGARSVIAVGLNCFSLPSPAGPACGRIARYATGPDYHGLIKEKLNGLLEGIRRETKVSGKVAVDSSASMDRALARRAGLGWAGKSSCLISPLFGPWLLLGELIVDLELVPDEPVLERCGTCERCIKSCPTAAITAPGIVDARRCIAYLTVEAKGAIPREMRGLIGNRMFGCDVCQESCPWSRFATQAGAFPSRLPSALPAMELLAMDEGTFKRRFSGSCLARTGRARMARNAAVVLGNLAPPGVETALEGAMNDPEPLVRGHAAWAFARCGGREALRRRLAKEPDAWVRTEIAGALEGAAG